MRRLLAVLVPVAACLVFAATDSARVNDAVVRDAKQRNILVSRADSGDENDSGDCFGDFIVPAVFRDGPVTLAVSTGSPALAVFVRDALAEKFEPAWARMAEAMKTLRPQLRDGNHLPAEIRRRIFRDLATQPAMDVLQTSGMDGLEKWLRERHPEISSIAIHARG